MIDIENLRVIDLVRKCPNDMTLGEKLRAEFGHLSFVKEIPNNIELGNKVRNLILENKK